MIVVENVKITNRRLFFDNPRGNLKQRTDRLDVCKYTLASYTPLLPLISKLVLYIDLKNTEYAGQENNLEKFIREIYPEDKLTIRWFRNETFAQWREACEKDIFPIDDDIIMNVTNDDHVFIDNNIDNFAGCLENLKKLNDPYANLGYSHWQQIVALGVQGGWKKTEDECSILGHFRTIESADIMTKERWRHYWFDHDGPIRSSWPYFRPETLQENGFILFPNGHNFFGSTKELCRHFDGYENSYNMLHVSPPLEIPDGFFENQIKIRYGYDQPKQGWVHINPAYPNYKSIDLNGVDYKYTLDDIPAFWRDRISEVDINPHCDHEFLKEKRDEHLYEAGSYLVPTELKQSKSFFRKHYISNKWKEFKI